jgi:hypothetical protein
MLDLCGKKGPHPIGIANDQSIAWGVAEALPAAEGASSCHLFKRESRAARASAELISAEIIRPLNVEGDAQMAYSLPPRLFLLLAFCCVVFSPDTGEIEGGLRKRHAEFLHRIGDNL